MTSQTGESSMDNNCRINLEMLGLTQQEFQDRVIESVSGNLMTFISVDQDGEWSGDSAFHKSLRKYLDDEITRQVIDFCEKEVGPKIAQRVDELTFPQTNSWGEKKKEPLSFREMVMQKAEKYLHEKVDHNGRRDGSGKVTRMLWMIDKHLGFTLGAAIKDAMKNSDDKLSKAIIEAVESSLKDVTGKIGVAINRGNR